jgi:hypothetical protein
MHVQQLLSKLFLYKRQHHAIEKRRRPLGSALGAVPTIV